MSPLSVIELQNLQNSFQAQSSWGGSEGGFSRCNCRNEIFLFLQINPDSRHPDHPGQGFSLNGDSEIEWRPRKIMQAI